MVGGTTVHGAYESTEYCTSLSLSIQSRLITLGQFIMSCIKLLCSSRDDPLVTPLMRVETSPFTFPCGCFLLHRSSCRRCPGNYECRSSVLRGNISSGLFGGMGSVYISQTDTQPSERENLRKRWDFEFELLNFGFRRRPDDTYTSSYSTVLDVSLKLQCCKRVAPNEMEFPCTLRKATGVRLCGDGERSSFRNYSNPHTNRSERHLARPMYQNLWVAFNTTCVQIVNQLIFVQL